MLDVVALGALFLLALIGPAYAGDPAFVSVTNTPPELVVLGIGGAAGVGALISLTGQALWNFLFPYIPGTGVDFALKKLRPNFRTTVAPELGDYWKETYLPHWKPGDRELISTQFLFYRDADKDLVGWVRRRHARFGAAMSALVAIGLGLVSSFSLPAQWSISRVVIDLLLFFVGVATYAFAAGQRREAERMEEYWFHLRSVGLDSNRTTS